MALTPMFPLGDALLPGMPLALRVFEARYLAMLAETIDSGEPEFGVVLIERGQEVGGGDHRFGIGTMARVLQLEQGDGMLGLVARGLERFTVTRWAEDDPYPRAEVEPLPPLAWEDSLADRRAEAERVVRAGLSIAADVEEAAWPTDVALDADPVRSTWQLAGIAPVGSLDRVAFLRAASVGELLDAVVDATVEATQGRSGLWPDG